MLLGHFGVAFIAKRAAPGASLGMLVLAAQLADLAWPLPLLSGLEKVEVTRGQTPLLNLVFVSYPYSHSLLTQLIAGAALGLAYKFIGGERTRPSSSAYWFRAIGSSTGSSSDR